MKRGRYTLGPVIGYHGCDRKVAESVLSGKTTLKPSKNEYDWLGPGIYFWADSAQRGLDWATDVSQQPKSKATIRTPAVIGALIHPGLCLNLTDYGVTGELLHAHSYLMATLAATGTPVPQNTVLSDGVFLRRPLDCSVIRTVHELREGAGETPYDTVYGVFEEGPSLYPGAGFKSKTHVQIAVRNPECIIGLFRV